MTPKVAVEVASTKELKDICRNIKTKKGQVLREQKLAQFVRKISQRQFHIPCCMGYQSPYLIGDADVIEEKHKGSFEI